MTLPWMPGAIRAILLADSNFTALCDRVLTRAPQDASEPYVTVQVVGGFPLAGDDVAFSPMVQVNAWCAPGGAVDPEVTAWNIAAQAAKTLARAKNVLYEGASYSARLTDGPLTDVDTSRGDDVPLYRALIRAELVVHVP